MKLAVIGSRNLTVNLADYLSGMEIDELVSGGARGIDRCVRRYAEERKIPLREFLPDYNRYGKVAPLRRNIEIVEYADAVVAFWDGSSRGTKFVIDACRERSKPIRIFKAQL